MPLFKKCGAWHLWFRAHEKNKKDFTIFPYWPMKKQSYWLQCYNGKGVGGIHFRHLLQSMADPVQHRWQTWGRKKVCGWARWDMGWKKAGDKLTHSFLLSSGRWRHSLQWCRTWSRCSWILKEIGRDKELIWNRPYQLAHHHNLIATHTACGTLIIMHSCTSMTMPRLCLLCN